MMINVGEESCGAVSTDSQQLRPLALGHSVWSENRPSQQATNTRL